MNDLAKNLGITINGAYSSPNEHTFYFILDAKDLKSVTAFFSGIMLTHHTGRISSVISLKEASDILISKNGGGPIRAYPVSPFHTFLTELTKPVSENRNLPERTFFGFPVQQQKKSTRHKGLS